MRNTAKITTVIAALLVTTAAAASAQGEGGQAGAFLRIPVGARPAGMGDAFVAVADDANAQYYNPGAMYRIPKLALGAMYSIMSIDRSHYMGSAVYTNDRLGSFGLTLIGFRVSDIDGRDAQGNPTGSFDDSELALTLGYGRELFGFLGLGANVKYLSHSLAGSEATGWAFDVGAHSRIDIDAGALRSVLLGASLSNIGGTLEWNTASSHRDEIPTLLRVGGGLGFDASGADVTVVFEATRTQNESFLFQGGIEVWPVRALGLRVGAQESDLRFGLSIRVKTLALDYAYLPDALEEGATSRIAIQANL